MYTLIISIASSVAVSVLLKIARQHNIHVGQAIAINYVVAASLCLLLLGSQPAALLNPGQDWWVLVSLGVLLPVIFLVMAAAVQHAGIVLSDAAQRLSLFIPLIASFVVFGEQLQSSKLTGIGMALVALVCLVLKPGRNDQPGKSATSAALLLGVWLGYGTIDVLFKQMAKSGAAFPNSLFASFVLAGILMFGYLIVRHTAWTRRNMVAGLVLGLLNFSNIYFYIRAHQTFPENPTLVFSAMNIGVISLGTLIGAGLFKEKLSLVNGLGILLAVGAIIVLIPR